ncbi:MAG: L-2-hydroxyglutarate oxidase [Acidobacteriota bacterium]
MDKQIAVVGGGIVGLATAYRLQQQMPGTRVVVLEKEVAVGTHQSGHNSGVLHCGLYYKPGSRRARLAVRGIREMIEFCQHHSIAHEVCGKLVVAATAEEVPRLQALYQRGQENGLVGLRMLDLGAMREIEPHVGGIAAIAVPEEGIADYPHVCRKLAELVQQQGGVVITGAKVSAIRRDSGRWLTLHTRGQTAADFLITCAGLHSDRVAALTGRTREARIVPFRGEYYFLRPERRSLVRNLIYPVPDPRLPFLGVHFTRRITGGIEAGPNAVLALSREGYTKRDIRFLDAADALSYGGLWRFIGRYGQTCWDEILRSFSRRLFCESLQRLVPEIREEDLIPGGSGVRAQAMAPDGSLLDDFHFVQGLGELHLVNAPSPGATASLAIGEEIAGMVAALQ